MGNVSQQKSHKKLLVILVLIFIIVPAIVFYYGVFQQQQLHRTKDIKVDGVFLSQTREINDFNLKDHHGNAFTRENLKGHWTMMFFGFTNCGMVCPTTMAALNEMYRTLQEQLPDNKLPQVVMVSVDPDRDSQERMSDYVKTFNPHFIGARAEIEETVALEKQLHIAAAKMVADGEGKDHYTITHSAEILLFNPDAQLQAYLSYPHKPKQMVQDYKLILANLTA